MAQWVLECPVCKREFIHCEVSEPEGSFPDPFTGTLLKPYVPHGGVIVCCPNCNKSSVFKRHQLLYRAS